MVKVDRVAEVGSESVVSESIAQGVDAQSCAGYAVNSLDVESEELDSLDTMVDDHRGCGHRVGVL